MVNHLKKKYKCFMRIVSIIMTIYMLTGCATPENVKEIPIMDLIDLSSSNISKIGVSIGGGPQTIIDNSDQIEEICSFLSSAFTIENQYEEITPLGENITGGIGDYILIRYLNNATTHIQIAQKSENDRTAAGILIKGRIKEGEIKDKWRGYSLVNFSQQKRLDEILSMEPVS